MSNVIGFANSIINLDPRRIGFAGLVSDTSLLDVDTVVYDKTAGGALLFRAGTIAVDTGVTARGNRRAVSAKAADVAAGAGADKRFTAIMFSHNTCDERGEIAHFSPDTGKVINVKPANGVNTGRIWVFLNGATSTVTGGGKVTVADLPASQSSDADKPYVNGAAKAAAADGANAIPGWKFTGRTEIDPATGYNIAEVEIGRA